MMYELAISLLLISFIISFWAVFYLIKFLKRKKVIDIPVDRSNHVSPTPRGGGLAIVFCVFLLWPLVNYYYIPNFTNTLVFCTCLMLLALISFLDDIKSIVFYIRLLIHISVATFTVYYFFPPIHLVVPKFVPVAIERAGIIFAYVYFINLYNFMDGIDGISSINTLTVLTGISILSYLHNENLNNIYLAAIVVGSTLAFLKFNWPPSKIFLGDVGSISLGYIVGFIALDLGYKGYFWPIFIMCLYYLTDATITLLKRIFNGEKFWEAHSKHFFQIMVKKGYSHKFISKMIGILNIVLIAIALCVDRVFYS
ncbi:MAG: glycosyltransferase family 4 protein [Sphingobacteriia bacterium]|nr:glycosyltransferase family 4 protein [Sphingobacteriia bacterium]